MVSEFAGLKACSTLARSTPSCSIPACCTQACCVRLVLLLAPAQLALRKTEQARGRVLPRPAIALPWRKSHRAAWGREFDPFLGSRPTSLVCLRSGALQAG